MTTMRPIHTSIPGIDPGSNGIRRETITPAQVPRKAITRPYLCRVCFRERVLVMTMLEKYNAKIKFGINEAITKMRESNHKTFWRSKISETRYYVQGERGFTNSSYPLSCTILPVTHAFVYVASYPCWNAGKRFASDFCCSFQQNFKLPVRIEYAAAGVPEPGLISWVEKKPLG